MKPGLSTIANIAGVVPKPKLVMNTMLDTVLPVFKSSYGHRDESTGQQTI
jgi:hypothetical protein